MFSNVRASDVRREFDRSQWPTHTQLIIPIDIEGVGEVISEEVEFTTIFEGQPFFSYGIELQPGETLVGGDFPFVNAGISGWVTSGKQYIGASLYLHIVSRTKYRLRLRASFEGTAYRSSQYFR